MTGSNWWRTDGRQLGDYRVDDPHIQADLQGPHSDSVLDSNAHGPCFGTKWSQVQILSAPTIFGLVNAVRVAKKAVSHRLRGLSRCSVTG